jgi:S-formylglutathione hydrolase
MLELLSETRCFGGLQRRYRHHSHELGCAMVFGVFLPPAALGEERGGAGGRRVPTLWWLSGLTCTDENFTQKAGAQRRAAELGLAIVTPDTSPRGPGVPDAPDGAWDFGHGAGFYVDASQEPWARHYRMHSYVVHELPALAEKELPLNQRRGISGHSMGGHGALICCLRNPGRYRSLSAFAPIAHPTASPWGRKALGYLLGPPSPSWDGWDASRLLATGARAIGPAGETLPLLVDQGTADEFLAEQLRPEALITSTRDSGQPLELRLQEGYDHSHFFIATFIDDHLHHHAQALLA